MPVVPQKEIQRFWSKVNCDSNLNHCWDWIGGGERYGAFKLGNNGDYKASRIAYYLWHGVDPRDMSVLHTCDNPKCCNHTHLGLGTHSDNMIDMIERERRSTTKLTKEIVLEMRELYRKGISQKDIGLKFRVDANHVNQVVSGKIWKHI